DKATCCEHGTPGRECRWRRRDANFGRQRALSLLDEPSAEERAPKKTDRCASLKSSKDKSASARVPFSSRTEDSADRAGSLVWQAVDSGRDRAWPLAGVQLSRSSLPPPNASGRRTWGSSPDPRRRRAP